MRAFSGSNAGQLFASAMQGVLGERLPAAGLRCHQQVPQHIDARHGAVAETLFRGGPAAVFITASFAQRPARELGTLLANQQQV